MAFLERVMEDPTESDKSRMAAAFRLDELYARFDTEDARVAAHKRRLELRALQVNDPSLPLPASDAEIQTDAHIQSVFNEVLKPGGAK